MRTARRWQTAGSTARRSRSTGASVYGVTGPPVSRKADSRAHHIVRPQAQWRERGGKDPAPRLNRTKRLPQAVPDSRMDPDSFEVNEYHRPTPPLARD